MYVCIYKASVSPGSVQQILSYYKLLLLQRQSTHLNGRMLDRRQDFITTVHGPDRKRRFQQ
jgi:hypothetical protein